MAHVTTISAPGTDELLAEAFPKSQHPVTAWRLIVRGEVLWSGPKAGPERRPETGPAKEHYAEYVCRVANEHGYASGFGLSQVYEMMKRVKHFDALDHRILDYLEAHPIPRAGLDKMLDELRKGKASAEVAMQSVHDWLAERGAYAKPTRAETTGVERAIATLRSLLAKLPVDTVDGKTFRAEALELLCAS